MRDWRAVAIDVDGTITDIEGRISTGAIEALREIERRGIILILATGNVLLIAKNLARLIGTCGVVIAENGGIVYFDGKEVILGSREKADRAFDYLSKRLPLKKVSSDGIRVTEVAIEEGVDIDEMMALLDGWNLKVEDTGFAIHITDPGVNKLEGLKVIAEAYNIDLGDIIAVGDSDNDAEMLEGCGIGIAVANASPNAKRAAGYVTKGYFGDGLMEALKMTGMI
jgi:hypothetical protein